MMMTHMFYEYKGFADTSNICSANGVSFRARLVRWLASVLAHLPPCVRSPRPWIMVVRLTYLIL